MWNGKNKALTFSFDDGAVQDERAIEILNRYGLKATFNLNSGLLGTVGKDTYNGRTISRDKISSAKVRSLYRNHEVAVHTISHPNLTQLSEDDIVFQVEKDRALLSELCGYEVYGMAYPCGGVNNDDRVAAVLREKTSVRFSRTITSTHNFDLQTNLFRFNPTVYYTEADKMFALAEEFLSSQKNTPQLFYIWGHTYELDYGDSITWERFEEFCRLVSGHDAVFYATNSQIFTAK